MKIQNLIHQLTLVLTLSAIQLPAAEPRELRVYMIGNSLTDNVNYDGFKQIAESRGYKHTWGRSMTPGAPIFWHWDHDPAFTQPPFGGWKKALVEYQWDAITLQPFSTYKNELEAAQKFVEVIQSKNPQAQVFIYAQWMTRDKGDFDVAWTQKGGEGTGKLSPGTRDYYERFVQDLRRACPNLKPFRLIPAGHAMYLLNQKIKAGQVPGFHDIREVYNDGIHLNNVGAYIAGCSFFATIYGESPVGLPAEPYQPQSGHRGVKLTPELARVIQETVWEIVATHSQTGVSAKDPLKVASPLIPDAVQGKRYETVLLPAFGHGPYRWSVASGQIPAGLALTAEGVIAGTASALGEAQLKFEVMDAAGASARRELTLKVVADSKPEITERILPPGKVGKYYRHQVQAKGGNGPLTWRPAKKESLPPGLELGINGELFGTPVKTGEVTFPVEASDADLGAPDTTTSSLTFKATEAEGDVLFVRQVAPKSVTVDGKLDEPFWKLDQKIGRLVEGQNTGVSGMFDVVTDGENLYVAIAVKDSKLMENAQELWNGDSVEVYLDTLNSRETVYNFNHRRLVCGPSGKKPYIVGEKFGIKFATQKTADGYTVELSAHNYGLGVRLRDQALGFDVAINDSADGKTRVSRLVWRGTKDNDTDPSNLGTIILPGATK
ncbi:MAG: sugar-binding protein [Verrucomicrobiota bacterium]